MKGFALAKALPALAVVAVVVAFVFFQVHVGRAEEPGAAVGQPAPDFALADEQGARHALVDDRGKIVVLEWTNSQCPFCQRHARAGTMKGLAQRYSGKVVWLAVNSSHFNTPADSQAWTKANGLPFPTLQDTDGTVGRLYGAKTTPHMFVIDAAGVLRYRGAIDDDPRGTSAKPTNYVAQAIDALLAGESPKFVNTNPYGCSVKYAK